MLKYIYIYVLKESQLYNNFSTSKYLFTLSFLSDPSNSPLNLISSKGSSNLHGVKDYPLSFTLKITTSQNRINMSCRVYNNKPDAQTVHVQSSECVFFTIQKNMEYCGIIKFCGRIFVDC